MTFQEVLKLLSEGKRVRRKKWETPDDYLIFSKEKHLVKISSLTPFITEEDINANDWELYTKYFNFYSAYSLMKDGKKVRRKKWNKLDTESIFIKDNFFLKKYDEHYGFYTVHDLTPEDLEAKDWYIVEED